MNKPIVKKFMLTTLAVITLLLPIQYAGGLSIQTAKAADAAVATPHYAYTPGSVTFDIYGQVLLSNDPNNIQYKKPAQNADVKMVLVIPTDKPLIYSASSNTSNTWLAGNGTYYFDITVPDKIILDASGGDSEKAAVALNKTRWHIYAGRAEFSQWFVRFLERNFIHEGYTFSDKSWVDAVYNDQQAEYLAAKVKTIVLKGNDDNNLLPVHNDTTVSKVRSKFFDNIWPLAKNLD